MRNFLHWYWHGRGTRRPWFRRVLAMAVFYTVVVPAGVILLLRFLPVPATPQMLIGLVSGDDVRYAWREADAISPYLARAVIGSEDQSFCTHHGFDWEAIQKAIKKHERNPRRRLAGASTISQQTARSLFGTVTRSWVRKGAEAYETVLLEALWPKRRIMTAYLNVVDWGHGIYGAEAAANAYFGKSAAELSPQEAARLAAILPNPTKYKAVKPGPYVRKRTGRVGSRIWMVSRDGLDWCVQ